MSRKYIEYTEPHEGYANYPTWAVLQRLDECDELWLSLELWLKGMWREGPGRSDTITADLFAIEIERVSKGNSLQDKSVVTDIRALAKAERFRLKDVEWLEIGWFFLNGIIEDVVGDMDRRDWAMTMPRRER